MAKSLLIVYDHVDKEQILKKILARNDYEVHSAGSGERALEFCSITPPDLIFLAAQTRDIDGFETVRRLRQKADTASIPVIFYSPKRDGTSKMNAYGAGVSDYIVEPFEQTEILARVEAHLSKTAPTAEMEGQIEVLSSINLTKDRLLRLYSQVNRLLSQVLTKRGHQAMMQTAMERTAQLTNSEAVTVGVFDRARGVMRYEYFYGLNPAPPQFAQRLTPTAADELYQRRSPIVTPDYQYSGKISLFKDRGIRASLAAPLGSDGELLGYVLVLRKSERPFGEEEEEHLWVLAPVLSATIFKARYEQKISNLVTHDPLTGLYNRSFGMEVLQKEMRRSDQKNQPLAALLIEVDNLREINAEHSYLAGDALLKALATLLVEKMGGNIHGARFGEEFLLVLFGSKVNEAETRAGELLKAIRELKLKHANTILTTTVSIGCAPYFAGESLQEFYSRCDSCLHLSKTEGGNRVTVSG